MFNRLGGKLMPNRNVNLIDIIDQYELIKTRKDKELLIRSPEGANFILDLRVAEKIASILLFDYGMKGKFNIPESDLEGILGEYDEDYEVDEVSLRQDRSLLAEVDGYTLLPTSSHGKDYLHLRKDGINFIIAIHVLFEIVKRYKKGEI